MTRISYNKGKEFSEDDAQYILNNLNTFLSDLNVFYRKLQNYHWNIKGKDFFVIHGKLEEYLRPITLFGDKFEEYLEDNRERNEVDWSSQYYDTVY